MTYEREDLAWAAGLFEGEGSITFYSTKNSRRRITVVLTSTDEDVIRKFHGIVGLGRVYGPRLKEGYKPAWTWTTTTFEEAQAAISLLWIWLQSRRRETAKIALSKYHSIVVRHHNLFRLSERHSKEDAIKIRELYLSGVSQKDIAKHFNRSASSISRILSGQRKAG